ncbi:hypothetical protein [Shewanella sp. HN-41]|uniref:hypothetical protein n=1 Tax=Shewanella sp. HN-41 TaxID=327275 RepID=UPI0002126607|nr:hypothetical protein [Shewanella sp. HN-41]EGM70150.1 hypothetical protein SOHN41_01744 [Shewanella sp. HN-41]
MLNCILFAVALTQASTVLPETQNASTINIQIDTQMLIVDIQDELEQQMQQLTRSIVQHARDGVLQSDEIEGLITVKD